MVVVQAKQREGNANLVVEIPFRIKQVVFGRQDGCQKFFGRCFPVRPSDGDDGTTDRFAMPVCQLLQRFEHIVDHHRPFVRVVIRIVNNRITASSLQRLLGESVPVEFLPFQGEEY